MKSFWPADLDEIHWQVIKCKCSDRSDRLTWMDMRVAAQLKKLSNLLGLTEDKFFLSAKMLITDGNQLKKRKTQNAI